MFGFCGQLSFIFLSTIQNKWKFTHTNFPVQWMKIMRYIAQLHELSEQPTYRPYRLFLVLANLFKILNCEKRTVKFLSENDFFPFAPKFWMYIKICGGVKKKKKKKKKKRIWKRFSRDVRKPVVGVSDLV